MLLLDFFFTKIKKKLVIVALFCMFTRFYTFFIDITAMRKMFYRRNGKMTQKKSALNKN